ncbi:L-aspartate oxidase [Candidatus Phycosocius bacilliformis]|uniref:L-aspartate oxidase n=1 Tax=Candidatus Phycosocius bacilliformis TaxID=1445552 RepID=A0A2P2ECQ9_9PROT|nr:L-aspartate oxidase [Candidatus Phycosocius bacilliformis]GBF58824.1 L-aspartate oxidase [Candidatus Phycosocius bacilliformis]
MDTIHPKDGSVLIVGAGLAGLFLALKLAPRPCIVVSPTPVGQAASSAWAQGGLAAALAPQDSPHAHAADTIAAGAGLVDPAMAMLIAQDGPARVADLLDLGVAFDRQADGSLALSLEAAHSFPRVARVAGDLAGREIMTRLIAAVRAADHITLIEGVSARALLQTDSGRIGGILAMNGAPMRLEAAETVLATGGAGGLFRVTTNPVEAAGHGLAMAARAGALIGDPEFIQFHPTAMDLGRDPAPLATEALRGEGARLVNQDGTPFMARYHDLADLAPRDIVARAVAQESQSGRGAYLDSRTAVGEDFPIHFPTVFAACQAAGLDPRTHLIPVAPAAHYHMGGIVTDIWGQTTLAGLSAIGECASTGVHGANRLASNSLLEAVVFAHRVAERLRETSVTDAPGGHADMPSPLPDTSRQALRQAMTAYAGVVRDEAGLTTLINQIDQMKDQTGAANELITARLIAQAALARTESRGGHYRRDFPTTFEAAQRSFITMDTPS